MGLDIRSPIGWLFISLGVILVGFGVHTSGDPMYDQSLGININLDWGIIMLVFGFVMLGLSRFFRA